MYITIDLFMNQDTTASASTTNSAITFSQNDFLVPRVTLFLGLDKGEILANISRLEEQLNLIRQEVLRRE